MSITALIIAVLALILNLVISFLLYYVYSVAPECADISDSLARSAVSLSKSSKRTSS